MGRTISLAKQLDKTPELKDLLKTRGARLKELGPGYTVYVEYDMNAQSIKEAVFKLRISGQDLKAPVECLFYKEELLRILRAV